MRTYTANVARNLALHAFALALLIAAIYVTGLSTFERDPGAQTIPAPHDVATSLLAGHDCWTGEAPHGVIPGHVVAMVPGGRTVYGGRHLTGQALEQFDGRDHHISVIAFCR